MEIIRGRQTSFMDTLMLCERLGGYKTIHMDIGTGDGRFVRHLARTYPKDFVIGIDACRENLEEVSRRAPSNALFVIANAYTLPTGLRGLAAHITINFPWGSLLGGLLANDSALMEGLQAIARPQADLEVRLNGGGLAEAGWSLEDGAEQVREAFSSNGFALQKSMMTERDLHLYPTTWAKRLAFGRDPRAACLRGKSG